MASNLASALPAPAHLQPALSLVQSVLHQCAFPVARCPFRFEPVRDARSRSVPCSVCKPRFPATSQVPAGFYCRLWSARGAGSCILLVPSARSCLADDDDEVVNRCSSLRTQMAPAVPRLFGYANFEAAPLRSVTRKRRGRRVVRKERFALLSGRSGLVGQLLPRAGPCWPWWAKENVMLRGVHATVRSAHFRLRCATPRGVAPIGND